MAIVSVSFQRHTQSEPREVRALGNISREIPVCVIYSNHPLALSSIEDAACSDKRLLGKVRSYCANSSRLLTGEKDQILVLDTCSVEDWPACLSIWHLKGGPAIALVSQEARRNGLELKMLCQGIAGVLSFAELFDHLPKAIDAVADGHLWFRREVLHTYVKQMHGALRTCYSSDQRFTTREREIVDLLLNNLSNRLIAKKLSISERTIKFHVSNILRKANIGSRKELRDASSPSAVLGFQRTPIICERAADPARDVGGHISASEKPGLG